MYKIGSNDPNKLSVENEHLNQRRSLVTGVCSSTETIETGSRLLQQEYFKCGEENDVIDVNKIRHEKFNLNEILALKIYSSDFSSSLNTCLRNGGDLDATQAEVCKYISSAFVSNPKNTKWLKSYKGISDIARISGMIENKIFTFKEYISTTISKDVVNLFTNSEKEDCLIYVLGKTGLDISKISLSPDEEETLYNKDTEFEVLLHINNKKNKFKSLEYSHLMILREKTENDKETLLFDALVDKI